MGKMKGEHNPMKAQFTKFEWDTNLRAYRSVCLCSILCTKVNIKSSADGKVYHSVEKFEMARST